MGRIKITHDTKGHTLTVWWGNPDQEYLSTLTEDEVIVMKDPGSGDWVRSASLSS